MCVRGRLEATCLKCRPAWRRRRGLLDPEGSGRHWHAYKPDQDRRRRGTGFRWRALRSRAAAARRPGQAPPRRREAKTTRSARVSARGCGRPACGEPTLTSISAGSRAVSCLHRCHLRDQGPVHCRPCGTWRCRRCRRCRWRRCPRPAGRRCDCSWRRQRRSACRGRRRSG